jgi:hypothetical protein
LDDLHKTGQTRRLHHLLDANMPAKAGCLYQGHGFLLIMEPHTGAPK